MATVIYLSNDPSAISGYKKAYIGSRGPNASATVSTTVTATTSGGSDIAQTLTSGGTTAAWITAPLLAAVTVSAKPIFNVWALESNAAANAQVRMKLQQYTTSAQTALLTSDYGTEATTSAGRMVWAATESVTSTAFSAGDRLIIAPFIHNVGTMGASQTLTMDYNGLTAGADGDTFVVLNETLTAQNSQYGNGSTPFVSGGPGLQSYQSIIDNLTALRDGGLFGAEASLVDLLAEIGYQRDLRV